MKFVKAFAAVIATAALAMGTVTASSAASETLTIGSAAKPVDLAASAAEYGNRVWFYQAVYDTLLKQKADGTLIPGIATKWTYNGPQTRLTLELRSGVKFTDGAVLDAAAVVANLNANKAGTSPTANYLTSMSSAKALDSNTVEIKLSANDPSFLSYLANTSGLLASPKSIGSASSATKPVGSGPYILDTDKTVAGSKYVYTANPNYWDKANRSYDNLVINVYEEQTAMVNAIKSGAVQAGNVADPSTAKTLVAGGWKTSQSFLDAKGIYFSDRSGKHKSCIANADVRRAINMAFDRTAMMKSLDGGAGTPTAQYFAVYTPGFDKKLDALYPYDVAKAKALMAKAGYAKGCTITMPTLAMYFTSAAYAIIKSTLSKIGVKVKEVAEAPGTFINNIVGNNKLEPYMVNIQLSGCCSECDRSCNRCNSWNGNNYLQHDECKRMFKYCFYNSNGESITNSNNRYNW